MSIRICATLASMLFCTAIPTYSCNFLIFFLLLSCSYQEYHTTVTLNVNINFVVIILLRTLHLLITASLQLTCFCYRYDDIIWDRDVIVIMNDVRVSPPCTGSAQLTNTIKKQVNFSLSYYICAKQCDQLYHRL